MKRRFSAGGIVFNSEGKILLVRNASLKDPNVNYWGFPKGHLDPGETSEQAATREIKEETGIDAQILKKIGDSRYVYTQDGEKIFKIVTIFVMKQIQGEINIQQEEIGEAGWFTPEEALEKLSFKQDQELLQKALQIKDDKGMFVSRGGIKLQAAIEKWKLKFENLVCLDIGSSTGGFVDCLLQNGAAKVYSVDTAYGELAWKLRNNPRVVVMERTNILHLKDLPELVDLVTIDAGWTKLGLVLPVVKKFLQPGGQIIALLKPHYEADKKDLVKGVLPPDKAEEVKEQVLKTINDLRFTIDQIMESPILGGGGNQEYLFYAKQQELGQQRLTPHP